MSNSLTHQIISDIFIAARTIHKKFEDSHRKPYPLLYYIILRYINEKSYVSMKNIADFLSITPPSATSIINRLIKLNLLKRQNNPKDRRIIKIVVTSKGKKVLENEMKKVSRHLKEIFSQLNQKEQKQLVKILTKIGK